MKTVDKKTTTFKDFFFKKSNASSSDLKPFLLSQSIENTSLKISGFITTGILPSSLSLTTNEKKEFSEKVSTLVHSEDFIQNLSNAIGEPKKHESEIEFVSRAKNTMRKLLKEKLK